MREHSEDQGTPCQCVLTTVGGPWQCSSLPHSSTERTRPVLLMASWTGI